MPDKIPAKDLKADLETVRAASTFMFEQFLTYAADHKLTLMDVFMIGHNVHKQMVTNVAARWYMDGIEPERTFREADMTWRQAMREMSRASFKAATAKP